MKQATLLPEPPAGWTKVPLWTITRRVEKRGRADAERLSVYRDLGVVPTASRADNYNKPGEDLDAYKYVEPGDLVLNKMKTWQGSLGVSNYPGIVSPAYFVCTVDPSVHPRYLHHLLRSQPYIAAYAALSKGIRPNQWDLPFHEFRKIEALLPPLDEQRRIAHFLDAETARIDLLISLLQAVKTQVHERRLGQVYDLVTGASDGMKSPTSLAWVEELPSHWPVVKLTYVARLGSGHTPSRSHPEWWTDCYIPWITTGEVQQVRDDRLEVLTGTRESISDLGLANSSAELHTAGTVVLCRTASAGYSAVMGSDMATSQDFAAWTCGPRLDPFFLLWCLRAMRPDLLGRLAMGSTHKTIYMPDIQSIRVPLPSVAEQQRIVGEIKERNGRLDRLLDRIDRQRLLLAERKSAVITAAVTGQLNVTTARGAA